MKSLTEHLWFDTPHRRDYLNITDICVVAQEIVLLHGFIKKQQKTPPDELDLAKKRKRQYLQNL